MDTMKTFMGATLSKIYRSSGNITLTLIVNEKKIIISVMTFGGNKYIVVPEYTGLPNYKAPNRISLIGLAREFIQTHKINGIKL